jgi:hypothetical protein
LHEIQREAAELAREAAAELRRSATDVQATLEELRAIVLRARELADEQEEAVPGPKGIRRGDQHEAEAAASLTDVAGPASQHLQSLDRASRTPVGSRTS